MINVEDKNLRNLFAQTPEMFCILRGPDHTFEFVNEAHIKILGFNATGKSVREAQPESIEVHGILDDVYKTGKTSSFQEIPVTVGDSLRYFDLTFAASRDMEGNIKGIMILGSEVTNRVLADEKVKRAHENLVRILMQAPAGVAYLKGAPLVFEIVNNRYLEMVDKGDFIKGKPLREAFAELEEPTKKIFEDVFSTGKAFSAREFPATINRLGGTEIVYFDFSAERINDPYGNPEGVVIFAYDVTEQVILKRAVEQNASQILLINESVPQVIWTADAHGFLNYTNARWTEYSSSTNPAEWIKYVHPEDVERVNKIWSKSIETGAPYETEFRLLRQDGIYHWFLVRASPVRDENGAITKWYGSCTDIEAHRKILTELELERELRDQFVSMLTHDLRNPLSAAKVSAQIIRRTATESEKISNTAGRIVDNINRANKLIENLLDANKIKAGGKLQLEINEVRLNSLVEDVLIDLATVHGDRFEVKASSEVINGHWSSEGIRRIMENLCINAVKYGDERTPIEVRLEENSGNVKIAVHNYGNAIPEEDQKKLFDPYQRTVDVAQGTITGWGLGLTLVRGVAEAHGGMVEVKSVAGDGTTFTVLIPLDSRPYNPSGD